MAASTSYFDTSGWDPRDVLSGGSRMIPINTPVGEFRVWTKRVGTCLGEAGQARRAPMGITAMPSSRT
jgi:hypothetical protein